MKCPCGYDCFNCMQSDCVVSSFPKSQLRESDRIDLQVLRDTGRIRFRAAARRFKPFRGRPGTYYAAHRQERLQYGIDYYYRNRHRCLRYALAYYWAHHLDKMQYQRAYYYRQVAAQRFAPSLDAGEGL